MTEPHDVLEALLFASDAPVEAALIQEVLDLPSADAARALVEDLRSASRTRTGCCRSSRRAGDSAS